MGQNQSQAPNPNNKGSTSTNDSELRLSEEYIKSMQCLEQTIFSLNDENIEDAVEAVMSVFSDSFPCTSNLIICKLIFSSFVSQKKDFELYLRFMKTIDGR